MGIKGRDMVRIWVDFRLRVRVEIKVKVRIRQGFGLGLRSDLKCFSLAG